MVVRTEIGDALWLLLLFALANLRWNAEALRKGPWPPKEKVVLTVAAGRTATVVVCTLMLLLAKRWWCGWEPRAERGDESPVAEM